MKKALLLLSLFTSCRQIGDFFENITKITGKYFLVENSWGGHSICYQTDETYMLRGSPDRASKLLAYAFNDSILVMKYKLRDSSVSFFALNMKKDYDKAKYEEIFLDTIKTSSFNTSWLMNLHLKFKSVD